MEKSHILLVNYNFLTHKIFKNENVTDVNVVIPNLLHKSIIDSYLFSLCFYNKVMQSFYAFLYKWHMQFLKFIKCKVSLHTWILILCKYSSHLDPPFLSLYASFIESNFYIQVQNVNTIIPSYTGAIDLFYFTHGVAFIHLYHMIENSLIESYTRSIIMKNALVGIYYSYINNLDECFYANCHILLLLTITFLYEFLHSDSNSLYAYYARSQLLIFHIFYIRICEKYFMPFAGCGDFLYWCKCAKISLVQCLLLFLFSYCISVSLNSIAPKHLLQPQGVCYITCVTKDCYFNKGNNISTYDLQYIHLVFKTLILMCPGQYYVQRIWEFNNMFLNINFIFFSKNLRTNPYRVSLVNAYFLKYMGSSVEIVLFYFLTLVCHYQSFQHKQFWNNYQNGNLSKCYTYKNGNQNFLLLFCLFLNIFNKNCPFWMFYFNPSGFSKALNMYKPHINFWASYKYPQVNTDHVFNFFFIRRKLMATKLLKLMYIKLLAIYFKYVFIIIYIANKCQIKLVPFIIVFTAQLYIAVIFKALYIAFIKYTAPCTCFSCDVICTLYAQYFRVLLKTYLFINLPIQLLNYRFFNGVLSLIFGLFLHIFGIVHATREESIFGIKAKLVFCVSAIGQPLTMDSIHAQNIFMCQPYSKYKLTRGRVLNCTYPFIYKQ